MVTGMGIISAIGNNLSENYDSLHHGRSGIAKAAYFESVYTSILPFGEVKCSNEELKKQLYFRNYGEHLPDDFFKNDSPTENENRK